jgi:hypothetical protein
VLFEELFYNADFKGFRVMCIESPFVGGEKVSKQALCTHMLTSFCHEVDIVENGEHVKLPKGKTVEEYAILFFSFFDFI